LEPEKEKTFLAFDKGWKGYEVRKNQAGYLLADAYYKIRAKELKFFFKSKLKKEARILHIACGTGKWSAPLLEEGFKITHFELSMNALKIAEEQVKPYRVSSVRGDAFNLPFKSESFDAIMSFGFLEHFAEIEKLIEEMVRVLKKRGVFFADIASGKTFITKTERIINFIIYIPFAILKFDIKKIKGSLWFIKRNYYENSYTPWHYIKILKKFNIGNIKIRSVRFFPLLKLPHKVEKFFLPLFTKMDKLFIPPSPFQKIALLKSAVWEITGIKE